MMCPANPGVEDGSMVCLLVSGSFGLVAVFVHAENEFWW